MPEVSAVPESMTVTQRGMLRGLQDARSVLDLEFYSEMKRTSVELPDVDDVPLTKAQREEWLIAYAIGIKIAVSGQEVPRG